MCSSDLLVRNLEHSHRFLAPRLARETAESNPNGRQVEQVSTGANVNFDLLAEYNPLPETVEKPAATKTTKPAIKTPRPATKTPKPAGKTPHVPATVRKAAAQ